ncbi:unnamed protein product [Caenorhabditis brenneri]
MEPSAKRARLSGEEVEDGPAPRSLFDLSLHAMIENAKNEVYPIEVNKISPLITDQIWKQSSLLNMISSMCHPGTFDLFSKRVMKPSKIEINFFETSDGEEECCDLQVQFEDGRNLHWVLSNKSPYREQRPNQYDPLPIFQVGEKIIKRKLREAEKCSLIVLDLTDSWNSRFKIIDWLVEACRCKVTNIRFGNTRNDFDHLLDWNQLKTARSLYFSTCSNSEFLQTILSLRHENNLTTSVYKFECPQPLPLRFFEIIGVHEMSTDLSSFSFEDLIQYSTTLSKIFVISFQFKIQNFNTQEIKTFKTRLNLSDNIDFLKENYEINSSSEEIFNSSMPNFYSAIKHSAFVYYFLEETPGVYHQLLGHCWKAKPHPIQ